LQQNTHVAIPFVVSSRGYGLLWNNPATGRVDFARNLTRWTAQATPGLDYWIVAGDTPREIVRAYARATGAAPMLPHWASGFWQCKLRYRNRGELLAAARGYRDRGLPLSCIVIDFFAWSRQGEWRFDETEWPDVEGMLAELDEMGVRAMVSIWPTVSNNAETYAEMRDRGYLLRTERGVPAVIQFPDKNPRGINFLTYYDAFNPEAREFHWNRVRQGYVARGIRNFWLDACEPEMRPVHPEHVRTALGNGAEMLCAFPRLHAERYAEGLAEEGIDDAVLLCRSTWAGGQRGPVILWSGDVWSTWEDYRAQIAAGLHSGMAGIGWWTTDIGGFYDGHPKDPAFHELLVRWFEFGVFSPICRLHGVRTPDDVQIAPNGKRPDYGDELFKVFTDTGGSNEVWSFGERIYELLVPLLWMRERLRPYIMDLMRAYSQTGDPVMRPVAYEFPRDEAAAGQEHVYLLGPDILVAPVVEPGAASRKVRLPQGADWVHPFTGATHEGGSVCEIPAPLGQPSVLVRAGRGDLVAVVTG
jgi:alpha-D-xyloside xylohydrolase